MYILFRLLDILADRKNKSGLSGDVLVNGEYQPINFRMMSGYVVQVGATYTHAISILHCSYVQSIHLLKATMLCIWVVPQVRVPTYLLE